VGPPNWDYFLAIEADLSACARYVSFSQENYKAHSIEFAQIILRAGSEIDSIAERVTSLGQGQGKWPQLKTRFPQASRCEVEIRRFGLKIVPWAAWASVSTSLPPWWTAFVAIKHNRELNFAEASLEHAINSVSALFLLLIFSYDHRLIQRNPALAPTLLSIPFDRKHEWGLVNLFFDFIWQ